MHVSRHLLRRGQFPLGTPVLVMAIIAVIGGVATVLWPTARRSSDLLVWTFADPHADSYNAVIPDYERQTDTDIDLQVVGYRALNLRLGTMFMSGRRLADTPDIAEVEIGAIGQFFRPPVDEVGFVPLNNFLENNGAREIESLDAPGLAGWNAQLKGTTRIYTHNGTRWVENASRGKPDMWIDRIVRNRTAPWSKEGTIFGVPHDVHPVVLAYRKDLFDEAGVDLDSARTWPEFQERCLQFKLYWRSKGKLTRHPIDMPEASAGMLILMINQQHINLVDDKGNLFLTHPKVIKTTAFYAQLVEGAREIAGESSPGTGNFTKDLVDGNLACYFVADWRVEDLRRYGGDAIRGKMRVRPLPIFDEGDAPTATWGGTMMGILRTCPQPEKAWKLLEFLYFSPEALEARRKQADILPPVRDMWALPHYHEPDPFFGGQKVNEVFIGLADRIPQRYNTPATPLAGTALTMVLSRAVDHVRASGPAGLEEAIRADLEFVEADLRRRIEHARISGKSPASADQQ